MGLHLDSAERRAMRNRLARARGQLDSVIKQLDDDAACLDVLPQMMAANKAVDRATFAMVLAAIERCSREDHHGSEEIAQLRKLFLSLA
ncbi:MAG: metal-sensitive transcriptional regulator [Bowdeniella nasicola]|nr:metal-sensitive transcriptional regulator [Bowdeniella nasicola]